MTTVGPIRRRKLIKIQDPWVLEPDLLFRIPQDKNITDKIAAFDLVNTLIHSDRGFPVILKLDDWVWYSDDTPNFLRKLKSEGYTIVIFSDHRKSGLEELKQRMEKIIEELKIEPWIFFGIDKSTEKPNLKMWDTFKLLSKLEKISVDSFYVGDASGPSDPNSAYRWSDRDRKFAKNVELSYYTPIDKLPKQSDPSFPHPQEVIIIVGQQLSGSKEYVEKLIKDKNYVEVNRKSKALIRDITSNLVSKKSVVFSATNPKISDRKQIIDIVAKENVPVRIFWFSASGSTVNQIERKYPDIVLGIYSSNFERPGPGDGVEVVRIN
jgi:bifunctional polynucleotide phosphatase/kinase